MGLDECIVTCIQNHSIIHNSFIALNIPCTPPICPSRPHETLATTDLFTVYNYLMFFSVIKKTHIIKFIIITILNVQFRSVKYIHFIVQELSRIFTSRRSETLSPLNNSFTLYSQPLVPTILFSVSMTLSTLDTSHKWSHTVFVLLYLVYFT